MQKQCANPKCPATFTPKSCAHSFCSDHCRRAARGNGYRRARAEAMFRDEYTCQECGSDDLLECHHRKPLARGGDHSLGNLQTLCRTCHKAKHKSWRDNGYRETEAETGSEEYDYAA
jgi:5-methylcytosine-specific restriction endonuclease McrA